MLLRPGNAGSNTFADHLAVLTAAIRQIPSRMRSRLLVRVDGAGPATSSSATCCRWPSAPRRAVHQRTGHHRSVDEQAIGLLPAAAWQAAVDRGRRRAARQARRRDHPPDQPGRRLARRAAVDRAPHQAVPPQARNLTAFERATGWRYSIIVTNIPAARGISGVPGSHHAQFIDVLHRQHAVVEDGVRAAKSMGLRNLPSKTWVVNCGWVLAANLAADLAAWTRLLGLYDCDDLKDAEPDTLRYRLLSLPARLVRHARARTLKISRTWPWKEAFLACWQRLCACPHPPDQPPPSPRPERRPPRRSRSRCARAHRAVRHPLRTSEPDTTAENRHSTTGNRPHPTPESLRLTGDAPRRRAADTVFVCSNISEGK